MFQLEVSSDGSRLVDDQKPKGGRREASTDHLSSEPDLQNIYNAATNNSTTIRITINTTTFSQLHKTTFKRTEEVFLN